MYLHIATGMNIIQMFWKVFCGF